LNPFFDPFARNEDNGLDEDGGIDANSENLLTFKLKLDELVAYYESQL